MPTKTVIRVDIFISSPSDVELEREGVGRVIEKLNRSLLRDKFFLVPLLYKDEVPPEVGESAQLVVDRYMHVKDAFIMICILWSRMGTAFTIAETREKFLSGTYYEFMTAYDLYQQHGEPHVLLYHKTKENPDADPEQKSLVDAFIQQFHSDPPKLSGLINSIREEEGFEETIEDDLRTLLRKYEPELRVDRLVERPEFQEEARRLDAAMPRQTFIDEPTEVRVMVCLPNSRGLRDKLPGKGDHPYEITQEDIRQGDLTIAFPKDAETGELESTTVTIELDTKDFELEPGEKSQRVIITPEMDSGLITFIMTPRTARRHSLVRVRVKMKALDGGEVICGSAILSSQITTEAPRPIDQLSWQVASQRLAPVSIEAIGSAAPAPRQASMLNIESAEPSGEAKKSPFIILDPAEFKSTLDTNFELFKATEVKPRTELFGDIAAEVKINKNTLQVIDHFLSDDVADIPENIKAVLPEIANPENLEKLFEIAQGEADDETRLMAVALLRWVNDNRVQGFLAELLRAEQNPQIRQLATIVIEKRQDLQTAQILTKAALYDHDDVVRRIGAKAIIQIDDDWTIKPLTNVLLYDPDKNARLRSLSLMEHMNPQKVVKPMLNALNDDDLQVQCFAARTLNKIGSEQDKAIARQWIESKGSVLGIEKF
jgi:hypothetical protein